MSTVLDVAFILGMLTGLVLLVWMINKTSQGESISPTLGRLFRPRRRWEDDGGGEASFHEPRYSEGGMTHVGDLRWAATLDGQKIGTYDVPVYASIPPDSDDYPSR